MWPVFIPWLVALGVTLWGTWYTFQIICNRYNHAKNLGFIPATRPLPPVSILKPMKGIEPGMEGNLESFFQLDYPCFELLFSVAESSDPARELVTALMEKYPHVKSSLVVGAKEIGPNPKVNNLVIPYRKAVNDCILISDSNVRVASDYLRRLVARFGPDTGVVTSVVTGTNASGLGGQLEAVFLNSFYARWMSVSRAFGLEIVVGKSMLFRRSDLERFGGWHTLSRYIAEDYQAGKAMQQLGLKIELMNVPVEQYIGTHPFRTFWSRHLRWGRIRKSQAPIAFMAEPFLGSFLSGIGGAWAFHLWLGYPFLAILFLHLMVWGAADLLMIHRLKAKINGTVILAWLLREALAFPLWVHIACGNSINWRGNRLKILPGGILHGAS